MKASEIVKHLEEGGRINLITDKSIILDASTAQFGHVFNYPERYEMARERIKTSMDLYIDEIPSSFDSGAVLYHWIGKTTMEKSKKSNIKVRITVEEL